MPPVKTPERDAPRYVFEQPLSGQLGLLRIIVLDLSARGLQMESTEPLKAATAAEILIELPGASEKVPLQGEIVWTQMAKAAEGFTYRSGVRLNDTLENGSVVSILLRAYPARLERGTVELRGAGPKPVMRRIPTVSRKVDADRILLIRQVAERLQKAPDELRTLSSRARSALSVNVASVVHTEIELAVWEYLQHIVSLDDIDEVLGN